MLLPAWLKLITQVPTAVKLTAPALIEQPADVASSVMVTVPAGAVAEDV